MNYTVEDVQSYNKVKQRIESQLSYRLHIWNKHPVGVRFQIFTGIKRAPTEGGCEDQQVYEIFIGVFTM
jgi:hypothetical protein